MSQETLAGLVDTHQTTIAALEAGKRTPRPDLARRIHAVTGIHPTAWLAAAYESGG